MKTPDACDGLQDIRHAIDSLDHQIIDLMRQRMAYVKAAARFKPTESSIAAPERVAQMLPQRREWAEQAGLHQSVCDYVAGMTDRYAQDEYAKLFSPYERV